MADSLGKLMFITLGCAKNEVDTDRMRSRLMAAGYEEVDESVQADCVLINTCSFLASATEESVTATLELAEDVHDGIRNVPIVMCGCVPSRYGDDLPEQLPEVASFVPTQDEENIVERIDAVLDVHRSAPAFVPSTLRTVESASAYVKISDGCNRFCSFCAKAPSPGPSGTFDSLYHPGITLARFLELSRNFNFRGCPHDDQRKWRRLDASEH